MNYHLQFYVISAIVRKVIPYHKLSFLSVSSSGLLIPQSDSVTFPWFTKQSRLREWPEVSNAVASATRLWGALYLGKWAVSVPTTEVVEELCGLLAQGRHASASLGSWLLLQ